MASSAEQHEADAITNRLSVPEAYRAFARAEAVWTNMIYVSAIMTFIYATFSVVHYFHLDPAIRFPMVSMSIVSTVLFCGIYYYLRHSSVRVMLAHPIASIAVGIVLINSGMHLYLTNEPRETTNFVLVIIACGIFFYSTQWLLFSLSIIMVTWLGIVLACGGTEDWTHFGFFAIQVAVLSILAHTIRLRSLNKLLHSQIAADKQRQQLVNAVEEKDRVQERLRRLSEATFEAVFLHRNGRILDVNEQATRLFGYTRGEFQRMTMDALLAPEARTTSPFTRKTLHSSTGSKRDGAIHEAIAVHSDGRRFSIEFGALQRRPADDGIDAAAIRDITDRRRLEHRLRDFVENAIDYIYEIDSVGKFTYVNAATHRLLSHGESLIGHDSFSFIHAEDRERVLKQFHLQDFSQNPTLYQEFRVSSTPNDMERWVGHNMQPIFLRESIVGYRIVTRNVTDRVMAVRQALTARRNAEEADRSKSRFLSAMSHELRTPLNGILGFSQLLLEQIHGSINAAQRKDLVSLLDCSTHLLTLIDDLLDLSKADMNAIKLRPTPLSLESLIASAVAMIRGDADEKFLNLTVDVPHNARVKADSRRSRQILINLLSNAVKYSPHGGAVAIIVRPAAGNRFEIIVTDEGPGIPLLHQDKVFSEFYQSNTVRDGNLGGSGIGLALVKKLVTLHDGEVGYRDRIGGGSELWFTLEATSKEIPAIDGDSHAASIGQKDILGRILVVDDIEANIFLVSEALTAQGHTVETARNGAEAIEMAASFKPDLIFMDMRMPVMDGFHATTKLKSMPDLNHIPIVALTASVSRDVIGDCLSAGCVEHLGKPVQLTDLYACVNRNLMASRRPEKQLIDSGSHKSSLRVLIADDMEHNREFMAAFFQRLPDEATFVVNGKEAVEHALSQHFDVILMDVKMPELDGLEATRLIRQQKEASILPIVGLSGLGEEDDIQACLSAGMNDFITKPVRFSRILEVLDQFRLSEQPTETSTAETEE